MGKPALNKKIRFALILIPFFGLSHTLIADFPIGLPKESKLQYSTGVFGIEKAMRATNHILLSQIDSGNGYQVFACSYSPFGNQRASTCGDDEYLEPYINKQATIGWYKVDSFLGFTNDMPQLATLEVDGKVIRDYNYTSATISRVQNGRMYVLTPLFLFMSLLSYWFLGKIR